MSKPMDTRLIFRDLVCTFDGGTEEMRQSALLDLHSTS